jgi:hypothetical protein
MGESTALTQNPARTFLENLGHLIKINIQAAREILYPFLPGHISLITL